MLADSAVPSCPHGGFVYINTPESRLKPRRDQRGDADHPVSLSRASSPRDEHGDADHPVILSRVPSPDNQSDSVGIASEGDRKVCALSNIRSLLYREYMASNLDVLLQSKHKHIEGGDLKDGIQKLFGDEVTEEELCALLRFAAGRSGKVMVKKLILWIKNAHAEM